MKILSILFLGFSLLFQINVSAQSPDKILKRAAKALGGEKVWRNIKSRQITGKITRLNDGTNGNFQSATAQPNFYAGSFDLNGFEVALGYNGKSGWRRDSQNGLRTLTGDESRNFQAETNFRNNFWLNYKADKSKITAGGKTTINGKAADAVILTTAKGVVLRIYFDAGSGLPVRDEIPAGNTLKTIDYSDYQIIDGIQEPFRMTLKTGDDIYEIKLDSVLHNAPLNKTVFDFPQISNEPLPDIPALFKQIQANQEKVETILENYTYTQNSTSRELGKDGTLREKESETSQISYYQGYRIRRLTVKNGKALTTEEQAKEDKNVEKRIAEIEKKIAEAKARSVKQSANGTPDDDGERISIAEILRASNLVNPRRERFRGREVIVFDFEPNPNFDYKNAKSFLKFFGKTAGVVWIDAADKQVARIEAVLADNFNIGGGVLAKLNKGASFVLENDRFNDEVWLPSIADINLSVRVLLVKGINVNQLIKSGNYQKVNVEIKDAKVNDVKKP